MLGVHASLDHVATAVVSVWIAGGIRIIAVRIVVSVVVIVAIREEAESEAVAVMESATVVVVESATIAIVISSSNDGAGAKTVEAATVGS